MTVADSPAVIDPPEVPPEATEEGPDRLQYVNALLIALITLFGAYVAWRASVAGDNAGDASLAGIMATLNSQEVQAVNHLNLYENYGAYTQYTRYNEQGYMILADLPQAEEDDLEALEKEMTEAWDSAELYYFPREYLKLDGAYDTQRELGEAFAEAARKIDVNPEPSFKESDTFMTKSNQLVAILTALAVALVLFTMVETVENRVVQYVFLGLGLFMALGGVAATAYIEYL